MKNLTRIWLVFVAAYPVIAGIVNVIDFGSWLFDWDIDMSFRLALGGFSPMFLLVAFVVSIRERFCAYHRLCIASVFLVNINHLWAASAPPVTANSITIAILLAALTGIIGAFIHFAIQIKDFIKYVRIQSKKQDPYKGALRA